MFVRKKGNKFYLVENSRVNGKVKQNTVKYLGVNPNGTHEYLPKLNIIYNTTVLDVLQKLPDNAVDLIIADPPYFISKNRVFTRKQKDLNRHFGKWDENDNYQEFFEAWLPEAFRVFAAKAVLDVFLKNVDNGGIDNRVNDGRQSAVNKKFGMGF